MVIDLGATIWTLDFSNTKQGCRDRETFCLETYCYVIATHLKMAVQRHAIWLRSRIYVMIHSFGFSLQGEPPISTSLMN